jgi:HEAT repeat protein
LNDEEVRVRFAAAQGLGRFGPAAKRSIEALTTASEDTDPNVRIAAEQALWHIEKRPPTVVSEVASEFMVYDNSDYNKHATILGGFGAAGIPILIQRLQASETLAKQYFEAEAARFETMAARNVPPTPEDKERSQQRAMAIGAELSRIRLRVVDLHEQRVRLAIVEGLAAAGEVDLPALRDALRHEDARVRAYVANALGLLGRDARPAAADLAEALSDRDYAVRIEAAAALEQIDIRLANQTGAKQVLEVLR